MENSRLKMRFIDDKDMLNKVLILTFYFLLLGNNAATLREFPLSLAQWTWLHCKVETPIIASDLCAIILTRVWFSFFLLVQSS